MYDFDFELLRSRNYRNYDSSHIELEKKPHLPTMGLWYYLESTQRCGDKKHEKLFLLLVPSVVNINLPQESLLGAADDSFSISEHHEGSRLSGLFHFNFNRVFPGGDVRRTFTQLPYHQPITTSQDFLTHRFNVTIFHVDTVLFIESGMDSNLAFHISSRML